MGLIAGSKFYSVLIPKDAEDPIKKAKFIPEGGFAPLAAVFKMFWALFNTLWLCAALLFLLQSFLMYLRFRV